MDSEPACALRHAPRLGDLVDVFEPEDLATEPHGRLKVHLLITRLVFTVDRGSIHGRIV
jgi:hypothetical protein